MLLDQRRYQEALEREREELGLATVFGGSSASSVIRPIRPRPSSKATGYQPRGASASGAPFQESEHPRDPTGRFIEKGDSGVAVRSVQDILGIRTDGDFRKRTAVAVRRFQRANGLQVDGVVGQQTAAALLGNDKADNIAPGALRPGQFKRLVRRTKK
jgi:Putative peptidoglycan binding domain